MYSTYEYDGFNGSLQHYFQFMSEIFEVLCFSEFGI